MTPLASGSLYKMSDPSSRWFNVNGYGLQMKTYVGVRMLSHRNIAAIVNIDITRDAPLTVDMVEEALLQARSGESGRTYILTHPRIRNLMAKIGKTEFMNAAYGDKDLDFRLDRWSGIPVVTSYNFMSGTEANVTV
jgi:hypothetical protein